jgi:hypothetical protein
MDDVPLMRCSSVLPIHDAQEAREYAVACAARVLACVRQGQELTRAEFTAVVPDLLRIPVDYWCAFEDAFRQASGWSTGDAFTQCAALLSLDAQVFLQEDATRIEEQWDREEQWLDDESLSGD